MLAFQSLSRATGVAAAGFLMAAASLIVPRPALALDDDGKQNVFVSVLGLLDLTPRQDDDDLQFRERAPLVLPPKMDLPPPAAAPARSADWPQDPDVMRHKKAAQHSLMPAILTRNGDGNRLSREQLTAGRAAGTTTAVTSPAPDLHRCGHGQCTWVPPDVLAAEGAKAREASNSDTVKPGVEPDRQYLSEPPKGYRRATQTVKATNDGPAVVHDQESPYTFWSKLNPFSTTTDDE